MAKTPFLPTSRHLLASSRGHVCRHNLTPRRCKLETHPPSLLRRPYTTPTQAADATPQVYHSIHEHSPNNDVATITIRNPLKLNILSSPILAQLTKTCTDLSTSTTLRAVILTGSPPQPDSAKRPSFIAGADIKEMSQLSSRQSAEEFITRVHNACSALRSLPVPVVARVHGLTLGAGLEVMLSCDLRIATELSTSGMPEVRVGIPSVVEAALLPSLIGTGLTRRLLYLAEILPAHTALQWGLIEKVVANDEEALNTAVQEWIDNIISAGPNAIRIQKRLMQQWENSPTVDAAIEAGVGAFGEAFTDGGAEPEKYMSHFINRSRSR